MRLPHSHVENKRKQEANKELTPAQQAFLNCPAGSLKEFMFWTEVSQCLPTQLRDFLNVICNKLVSYAEIHNFAVNCRYPLTLLKDLSPQTPIDTMVKQVVFSWWGNSEYGVGRNINHIKRAFDMEGDSNRFNTVIRKFPELMKLADYDSMSTKGPLKAH